MTIYDLARLNRTNGGCFFKTETMAHFGDTMKGFGIKNNKKAGTVVVTRKSDGREWTFDAKTGRLTYGVHVSEKLDGCRSKYPMVTCTNA
jgi:hypothetical protein